MKILKSKLYLIAIIAFAFIGCEKEPEDIGETIQNVPHIEVLGANPYFSLKGLDYIDEGVWTELVVGKDTFNTDKGNLSYKTLGKVNTSLEGSYKLTYEVKNEKGIAFYADRAVNVVDFTGYDVFEIPVGEYDGIRVNKGKGGPVYISKIREGIYSCSDLIGGYYEYWVGYGKAYSAPALLIIDSKGNIRSELGSNPWGRIVIQNPKYNAETKQLTWYMAMLDQAFGFDVQLTFKR